MPGKIILLNGASSSGKSTLARTLQSLIPLPFWHYSIDHLLAAGVLPRSRIDSGEFPWPGLRQQFFEGFHNSIPALARAGNHLIVEHIVESREWMDRLLFLLSDLDVFFVGLHCPLPELERRERERADRRIGEARADAEITHTFGCYDHECQSNENVARLAQGVAASWSNRTAPSAFARMASARRSAA